MAVIEEKNPKKWTKDGRKYYFDVYYTDMYGNRKEKKSKMYKSERSARQAETEFLLEIRTKDLSDKNITFLDAYNEWLTYKEEQVKATSFYDIQNMCNKYILSYFKKYKLHNIKVNDINNWKNELKNCSLNINSKNRKITYLQQILDFAVNNYDFDKKVLAKLQKFRNDVPVQNIKDAETNFWTLEEYNQFISIVDDNFYKLIFEFLYYTGLRIGEFRGLTWKNTDLSNKNISVVENLTTKVKKEHKIEGGYYAIITPKTKNSIRTLDLDNQITEQLKTHYENEKHLYNFSNNMFVFGNVKPISETTLRRYLDKYISLADVKRITPHGFRHSHVSLLIHLGCDAYEVAERIGDTVEMVLKTYYHMFPDKKKQTINAINKLKNTR